jgi:hypothetical protein
VAYISTVLSSIFSTLSALMSLHSVSKIITNSLFSIFFLRLDIYMKIVKYERSGNLLLTLSY